MAACALMAALMAALTPPPVAAQVTAAPFVATQDDTLTLRLGSWFGWDSNAYHLPDSVPDPQAA